MTEFEKVMEKSFAEYTTSKTAYLQFLYPKMRMAGYIGKAPGFVQCAKAPYDIDGYYMDGSARHIACEVKENADHHASLKIIMPEKRGTGLQYHQLEALVRAHESKCLACVVWSNGGEVGYLDGTRLKAAKQSVDASLKAEKMGLPNQKGMRSILWGNFTAVRINSKGVPLWLPENVQPTVAPPQVVGADEPEEIESEEYHEPINSDYEDEDSSD